MSDQNIEGIPKGYELEMFRQAEFGETFLAPDGTAAVWRGIKATNCVVPILRRVETCSQRKARIMDSLTKEQRIVIAEIIRDANIEGDYAWDGENSNWEESVSDTLHNLAMSFEKYDPESAIG